VGGDIVRSVWKIRGSFINGIMGCAKCEQKDELQLELHDSLVRMKYFKTEEEAIAFTSNGFMLSDVGHDDKGYYRAYTKVGQWMRDLAGESSRYYDMNVELKMDYSVGKTWLACH